MQNVFQIYEKYVSVFPGGFSYFWFLKSKQFFPAGGEMIQIAQSYFSRLESQEQQQEYSMES